MTITINTLTFDCHDALLVAEFWSAALGRPVNDGANASFASIAGEPGLAFMAVPESKSVKNRLHLDVTAPDRAAEVRLLLDLGATHVADYDEGGYQWTTLRDVEGNEFCVL